MPSAAWNGTVLAESDETILVEGNHYFPPDTLRREYFRDTEHHTVCHWKGVASYYDVEVDGQRNPAAAWYYPDPSTAAEPIKNYVGFWHGVRVEQSLPAESHQEPEA